MNFKNKKVLVCGMARSGISAAKLLNFANAFVTLQDLKSLDNLKKIYDIDSLQKEGISIYAGSNPDDIINKMDIIVLSPGIPSDLDFILKAESLNIPVISEIELAYMFTKCPVIAITGTNGKTTTTTLVGEILKSQYKNVEIVGNIGIPYSEKILNFNDKGVIVAEISSFQLEKIKTFRPNISAVLNITPDHLDRHKTFENYISAKEKIFENQTKEDYCILNFDDENCFNMALKTNSNVIFFSSNKILEKGIYIEEDNIVLKLDNIEQKIININDLQILGKHNYENVMVAIAICFIFNISIDNIIKVLKNFRGVEHRIEYVDTIDYVDYYNDSKGTNTDAAIQAVLAMRKPIVLIAGGYDKGSNYDELIKTFENRVKHIILIGETAEKIKDTCIKYNFNNFNICNNLNEALEKARNIAKKGDCVLLSPACASWGMFKDYEQRGICFKNIVKSFNN